MLLKMHFYCLADILLIFVLPAVGVLLPSPRVSTAGHRSPAEEMADLGAGKGMPRGMLPVSQLCGTASQ